ncbi:hypothetical protein HDG38_001254 [Paraburkholderia sp. WSM4177]|nr:hypothetical protein [Paraburkholderia sp. WSM4177]MBB5482535.1 hypothetical protein [Paraburkholderia sp. WSM4180]
MTPIRGGIGVADDTYSGLIQRYAVLVSATKGYVGGNEYPAIATKTMSHCQCHVEKELIVKLHKNQRMTGELKTRPWLAR